MRPLEKYETNVRKNETKKEISRFEVFAIWDYIPGKKRADWKNT